MPALDTSKPRLAAGCRWRTSGEERFLLFPEGAIRVKGTGLKILELCNGQRTFSEVVKELETHYALRDAERIRNEVSGFLERLHDKRIVDY
jgi:pyrroloquinoline quinone biosynthesis protein D